MVQDIAGEVIRIIADQAMLEVEDVTLESTFDDLGIGSLGVVESIFAIEEAFDIKIPFNANEPAESAFDMSSVRSIVAAIEVLIEEQVE